MSLRLEPIEEADLTDFVRVQRLAFTNANLNSITKYLSIPPSAAMSPSATAGALKRRRDAYLHDPGARFLKVVDTALSPPAAIAYAKWGVYPHERSESELEHTTSVPPPPPDANVPLWTVFFGWLRAMRRKHMSTRPHVFLHVLATDPAHQRRGAGAMLIEWGVKKADELGLETYLEASETGRPLYERFGFVEREVTRFDLAEFGGEGISVQTVMLRPAKEKSTAVESSEGN